MKHLHPLHLQHLHDAECKKTLGSGSYGCVKLYQCKEKCIGSKCACNEMFIVKRVHNKRCIRSLLNEYSIGISLDHKNIRKTLDIDLQEHSLIFEYCPGYDFFSYILCTNQHFRNNNVIRTDTLGYIRQLFAAVEYLHQRGIAHLDLKLENILVDPLRFSLKLIDFGQAIVYRDKNMTQNIQGAQGTIQYCPPEALYDEYYNPENADVWACGIILYNCVYCKFPWMIANNKDYYYKKHEKTINKALDDELFWGLEKYDILQWLFYSMLSVYPSKRCSMKEICVFWDANNDKLITNVEN